MPRRSPREERESRIAGGWTVEGDADPAPDLGSDADTGAGGVTPPLWSDAGLETSEDATADVGAERGLSTGMLILLGVIGGVYLIYTWVWFSWASYYSSVNVAVAEGSGVLGSILQQVVYWAAPLAPILWFLAALAVAGTSRTRALTAWLLIGAVVLVPLPMLTSGGAA